MEIWMEQALKTGFYDLISVVLDMVPCVNDKLGGMNNDDLGEISGGFVDCSQRREVNKALNPPEDKTSTHESNSAIKAVLVTTLIRA
jgi:hypothetical protein